MYHVVEVEVVGPSERPEVNSVHHIPRLREWGGGAIRNEVVCFADACEGLFRDGWLLCRVHFSREDEGRKIYAFQHRDVWTADQAKERLERLGVSGTVRAFFDPETELPF